MTDVAPPVLTLDYTSAIDAAAQTVFAFDGSATITGANVGFPVSGATVMLWFKAAPGAAGVVLGYAQNTTDGAGRFFIKNPSNLCVGIGTATIAETKLNCADGAWHHLAVTVAPFGGNYAAVAIFIDGICVWRAQSAIVNTAGVAIAPGGDLVLGRGIAPEPTFIGAMSQFVLWNGVLSDGAILSWMQVRPPVGGNAVVNWALTSAQTSGTVGGGSFVVSDPALRFRSARSLTASWTPPAAPATTFDLAVTSSDCAYHPLQSGLGRSPAAVPSPQAGVGYTARVRAVSGGVASDWSVAATAVALDLGQAAVVLAPAATTPFVLRWPAIDQAAQYILSFLQGGITSVPPSGTQTENSIDITDKVQDEAHTYNYTVCANGGGSTGPASASGGTLSAPALKMVYGPEDVTGVTTADTCALVASWPAEDCAHDHYLMIARVEGDTQTPIVTSILDGGTLHYTVEATVQEGQVYRARLRGLVTGALGPWSDIAKVTIHKFDKPTFGTITSDYNINTMTVPWNLTPPLGVTPKFDLQLWNQEKILKIDNVDPATSPHVFVNPVIAQGVTSNLRVRAYVDGSYGPWSDWKEVVPDGVPKVVGLSAQADVFGTISANWSSVIEQNPGLKNVRYVVKLYLAGAVFYTAPEQVGTSITMLRAQTGVMENTTYAVTVYAKADNLTPGKESDPAWVTIGKIEPYPPPKPHPIHDPVEPGTGAYHYANDDLSVSGIVALQFATCYSSDRPLQSDNPFYSKYPLGNRWSHSYNTVLKVDQSHSYIYILWGLGGADRFAIPAQSGAPYTNAGARLGSTLTRASDGYTLTQPGVKTYLFDNDGRLTAQIEPNGNRVTLGYEGGKLTTIADPQSNHTLSLGYDGDWLHSVGDGVRTVTYGVANDRLERMIDPRGKTRRFSYANGATAIIEAITDFSGVVAVKNSYKDGRIRFQQDARALAEHLDYGSTFQWSTGTFATTQTLIADVTDRCGNLSHFESISGNGALLFERYQLDTGNILVRSYRYDTYANLLSKTEYQGPANGYQTGIGNAVTYTYAACGRLAGVSRPLSPTRASILANGYDANGNLLTSEVYEGEASAYQPGKGNVTTRSYYPDNTLNWIQSPLGDKTSFVYWDGPAHGELKTMTDPLGNVFSMTWHSSGLPETVTDPYGAVTTYDWTPAGYLTGISIKDSGGTEVMSWTYEVNDIGQVKTATQRFAADGQPADKAFQTVYQYDDNGNCYVVIDAAGIALNCGYDPNNNLTSIQWPVFQGSARTISWAYDRNDFESAAVLSPANPVVQEIYVSDQTGRLVQRTDPNGAVYGYSLSMTPAPGPLLRVCATQWPAPMPDAPAPKTSVSFDPLGRPTGYVDRSGASVTVSYTTQTATANGTQQTMVTETRPAPVPGGTPTVTQTLYDALDRPAQFTNAAGKVWLWTYEIETDPATQKFVQVGTMVDPTGCREAVAVDSFGRVAFVRKAGGGLTQTTQYIYDAIGRLIGVTTTGGSDASATAIAHGFDAATKCQTVTVRGPSGGTVLYYDGCGDLLRQVNPFGLPSSFTYTPWGNLSTYRDGRANTLGYGFDAAGRLHTITQPDGTQIVHTLDANGNRLITQIDAGAGIHRTFDAWDRMLSRTDSGGHAVVYDYWPEGQIKRFTYPDGKQVTYGVDGLGRMNTVTDWKGRSVIYGWRADDRVEAITFKTTAGAVYANAHYDYDDAGRTTGCQHQAGNLIVSRSAIQLDGLGRPSSAAVILPLAPTLPSAVRTLTYKAGNQIDTIDGVAQAFDDDGNYLGPQASPPQIRYDIYGRVVGAGDDVYSYDADGLRTGSMVGGVALNHVYDIANWHSPQGDRGDPWRAVIAKIGRPTAFDGICMQPICADDEAAASVGTLDRLVASYGAGEILTARHLQGLGLLGCEDGSGVFAAQLADTAGNIVASIDENGHVTDRSAFGPYGDIYARGTAASSRFLFAGLAGVQSDSNGLLYMRARSYMPAQFRFLQPDYLLGDLRQPQSLNRYAFALGNPLQIGDPSGLAGAVITTILAIGGFAAMAYCLYNCGGAAAGGASVGAGSSIFSSIARTFSRMGGRTPTRAGGDFGGSGSDIGGGGDIEMQPLSRQEILNSQTEPLLPRSSTSSHTYSPTLRRRFPFSIED